MLVLLADGILFWQTVFMTTKKDKSDTTESIIRKAMSLDFFLNEILEKNKKEIEEIAEFERILEQITPREKPEIYSVSVTSNW